MKGLYTISCQNILTISLMKIFVVSVRLIVHSMRFSIMDKESLDCGGFVGTILMDLLKAYDCISHELLIAKLQLRCK